MNGSDYQKFSAYQRIWSITVRFLSSTALNSKIREERKRSRMQISLATLTRQFLLLSVSNKLSIDKGLSSQGSWKEPAKLKMATSVVI